MSAFLPAPDTEATSGHGSPLAAVQPVLGDDYGAIAGWADIEREAERAFLGTVMMRKPGDAKGTVGVEAYHMASTLHSDMLKALRSLYPWGDSLEMERALCATLSRRYGLKPAQMEVAACLCNAHKWSEFDTIAQAVVDGWKRRERERLAKRMLEAAHDPETVRALVEEMQATLG